MSLPDKSAEWRARCIILMARAGWTLENELDWQVLWTKEGRHWARLYSGGQETNFLFKISNGMAWGYEYLSIDSMVPEEWWTEIAEEASESLDYFDDSGNLNRGPDKGKKPKLTVTLELLN